MPLIRAGEVHGAEAENAVRGFFRFVCPLFSFFFFSLKICEIKEHIGQGGNACKMGESLGQENSE